MCQLGMGYSMVNCSLQFKDTLQISVMISFYRKKRFLDKGVIYTSLCIQGYVFRAQLEIILVKVLR